LARAEAEADALRAQLRELRAQNGRLEAALQAAQAERSALNAAIRWRSAAFSLFTLPTLCSLMLQA
jgi:uncharacterized protein (DUF3084 family)